MIDFSLFTHHEEVGKSFFIEDGKFSKYTNGELKNATVERVSINHIHELAEIINTATGKQHLTAGIAETP